MEKKIELIVHGIPKGFQAWSDKDQNNGFVNSYYREHKYAEQMLVELCRVENPPTVWYTYLVKETKDAEGRSGGYFGFSLKMNQLYTDFPNVYHILDATFHKYFVGVVLKKNGSEYQFFKPDFAPFAHIFKNAEQEIFNYLMQFSVDADFCPIPNVAMGNQICEVHVSDCVSANCAKAFQQYGKVLISTYSTSNRERSFVTEKQQLSQKITDLQKVVSEAKSSVETLKKDNSRLQNELAELKNGKSRMTIIDQENDRLKKKIGELSGILKDVAPVPIQVSASPINRNTKPTSQSLLHKIFSMNPLINLMLTLLLIICLLVVFKKGFSVSHHKSDKTEIVYTPKIMSANDANVNEEKQDDSIEFAPEQSTPETSKQKEN